MVAGHASNLRGTFGYLDPEYISTRTFTKKSDVYSYGVLLFELIAARNPLQGLMEYVELVSSVRTLLNVHFYYICFATEGLIQAWQTVHSTWVRVL